MPCADERIQIDGEFGAEWVEPLARLCHQFATMKDVDPSARLHITPAGDDVLLEATLGDSRSARRKIQSPDDLFTIVEALTVVIPSEKPAARQPAAPAAVNVPPPAPKPHVEPKVKPEPKPRDLGVELGAAVEARFSGSPSYLSAGIAGYASIRPDEWFFGVTARWQPSEIPASGAAPGFEMESAGAGFVVGHRVVDTPMVDLDVGASTLVLVDTQSLETRVPDEVGSATDVRFGLLVRALVGRSSWRFAPAIDADLAPTRLRREVRIDPSLPPLPAWSVGLALGASWVEP